jgi:ATP-binding cassette subfamily C protein
VLSQALAGDIVRSAATLGVFLSGGFRLTAALLPLQNALLTINSVLPSVNTAQDILALAPKLKIRGTSSLASRDYTKTGLHFSEQHPPVGVKFESVSYSYPDKDQPALTNVSFEVEPGTQVALMGPSGAGKSTIADLLCKVLTPTSGSITTTSPSGAIRAPEGLESVSYVPQKPGLVSGTVLQNVALAEDVFRINRELALEALRLAHLEDLILELPEGLDTPLGKLQDGLSGGQMQRLGLARALYTKPTLLVMDEATSALDAESEAEIQKALDDMRGKVTVVLIAHRLNTIQHADKVILVEEGRVKDSGTFKELIKRNPSVEKVVDLMRVEKD